MEKIIPQNKFEVLASRVMRSGEGREYIRQQEVEKKEKCFRYWGVGHYKWNIEVERKRQEEEMVHVVRPQKAQQKERLVWSL